MGDVVSSHLDENKRGMIAARTGDVMRDFGCIYEQQYSVALFNSVRSEIEGVGTTQSQLLHRKDPLAGRTIFSGSLLQHLEENRKWRNRYVSVPSSYSLDFYENKTACERGLQPKASINCAGYKALKSVEEYMELMNQSLLGVKAKVANAPFIKLVTQYPLILWHPYHRHHYFCVLTEREQTKWFAVLQDCVRHCNNGLREESMIQTPAFTNSIRLYRQAQGHYGSWDMMCGAPPQILANLVMESLHPKLKEMITPRLKGKLQQRQRSWMLICGAVYKQVLDQTTARYEALSEACDAQSGPLDAALRTDMDQIITSKEHVSNKIKAVVLPKAEQLLRTSVQPYVSSILEALMEPTSRGFSEVRDVFFKELVELSKNSLDQDKDKLGEQMERVSMLAFHPVKVQSCYAVVEELNLDELQQKFDVSSPEVFIGRAQILMGEQMDNAVYTFEQLLNQSLESQGESDLCKTIQKCQDRVLKKYDYDSSTVRKKFFREALLQIIVPYMLQQLAPSCSPELPQFQEMIFEDFSRFLLVENLYEEVVLQSVSKDIMSAVKEAAVQRRHNLYRDSIVLTGSDSNLHLLGEKDPVDWSSKFTDEESPIMDQTGSTEEIKTCGTERGTTSSRKRRQVVSMIQIEGVPFPYESCLDVPGVDFIPEEDSISSQDEELQDLKSPDSVNLIRDLINPVVQVVLPVSEEEDVSNGTELKTGTVVMGDGIQEDVTHVTTMLDKVPRSSIKVRNLTENNVEKDLSPVIKTVPQINKENVIMEEEKVPENVIKIENETEIDSQKEPSPITKAFPDIDMENEKLLMIENTITSTQIENFIETKTETCPEIDSSKKSPQSLLQQLMGSKRQEEEAAIKNAIRELEIAVEEEDSDGNMYGPDSDSDVPPTQQIQVTDYSSHDDSGFQSPATDRPDSVEHRPITNGLNAVDNIVDPAGVEVILI